MSEPSTQSIELSIKIAAPRELVFRYFSDPGRYKLWMGEQSTISPGAGGQLTVSFGPGPTAIGKIVEWREPERITFEWSHEGRPGTSLVTISLQVEGKITVVTLSHKGIVDQLTKDGTASGWRYYLSALGSAALGEQFDAIAPQVLETYLSAWSQADAGQRASTLASCVPETVTFRDKFGAIDGRQNLSDYIGGVQKIMGPAHTEPEGPLDRVHAFVRQDWRIRGPEDKVLFRGQNIYEFDVDCRLKLVVGFWR